jgi:hypothetical protein
LFGVPLDFGASGVEVAFCSLGADASGLVGCGGLA